MRDAFGGAFMIKVFLVFIFIYIVFTSLALNYAKAFKVKNTIVNYLENKPFKGSKVTPGNTLNIKLNNTNNFWYYNHPGAKNIPATTISLDDFNGKLNKGLFSLDGFASIDDSKSLVIDNDAHAPSDFVGSEKACKIMLGAGISDEEIKNIINNNKRIFEKAFGGKNG